LECAGFARDSPKVVDQVRLLARAVDEYAPRECVGRTAVFEAAGPGPTPGWGTLFASCPWGVTDSHTTLRRSWTRFDSWQGHHFSTLEPDGQATGCNPVQVGSTPTCVSASFARRKGQEVRHFCLADRDHDAGFQARNRGAQVTGPKNAEPQTGKTIAGV
jgi:hypothetical protein